MSFLKIFLASNERICIIVSPLTQTFLILETEDATPFVGALKHMLQDKTWTKEQKGLFYSEITSILVHPDLQTRVELLSILASFQNVDMGRVTRSYVEDKLRNGQLYISEEVQCFGSKEDKLHKPHWSDCKGIFGEVEIRIKLLVPTKNCISKSIDAKYKARQIAGHERFDNSLNIISHVHQNNGFHENIATLLAFQTNQMPLFYAIQADGTINFLQYLLRRRDRKEWLSFSTLCAYIKDAIAAITYLHSNNIVHRDITACRFELQEEQSRLKLTDFRLAKKLDTHTDELCLGKYIFSLSLHTSNPWYTDKFLFLAWNQIDISNSQSFQSLKHVSYNTLTTQRKQLCPLNFKPRTVSV